jgi:hypothetical protein
LSALDGFFVAAVKDTLIAESLKSGRSLLIRKRLLALGKPTGMMIFDKKAMTLFRELNLRSTTDNHSFILWSRNGGYID